MSFAPRNQAKFFLHFRVVCQGVAKGFPAGGKWLFSGIAMVAAALSRACPAATLRRRIPATPTEL
jgi:hypothetical protein